MLRLSRAGLGRRRGFAAPASPSTGHVAVPRAPAATVTSVACVGVTTPPSCADQPPEPPHGGPRLQPHRQGTPPPHAKQRPEPAAVSAATPIPHAALDSLLSGYDNSLRHYLVSGFAHGFSIGCSEFPPTVASANLPSCLDAPQVVDAYIARELHAGRLPGPFLDTPAAVTHVFPLGLIPKKTPGEYRVIHHLSYPGDASLNAHIPREHTAVQYGSIDDAIELLMDLDTPFLAKTDISDAFRLIPVAAADSPRLGFRWRGRLYADRALPMGCASSSQIFQTFSDALVWIAQRHFGAGPIVSVLDDFLFIGASHVACAASLEGFRRLCHILRVPLHPGKTVSPCRRLQFLGVELDMSTQTLRLPADKLDRARAVISALRTRRTAPLRDVQACIGLLNFACVAVPVGRPFLRRLSDVCAGVRRPHHRVTLTRAARLDLSAWLAFLSSCNGRSLLEQRRWLRSPGIVLETDAAGEVGIGAICGRLWLMGAWPPWLRQADIGLKELVAVVVPIQVWTNHLANRCVLVRSDNSGVVAALNSQSSRSPVAMRWLRHLFLLAVRHNILLRALHVPGVQNAAPDALSRGRPQVFKRLRPGALCAPTRWDWDDFSTLQR